MQIYTDHYTYHADEGEPQVCEIEIVHLGGRMKYLNEQELEVVESLKKQGFIVASLRHGDEDFFTCSLEWYVWVNHLEDVLVRAKDMNLLKSHLNDRCAWLEYEV